ncbi:hypothetical protein BG004_000768 [Podila humilis]|nr:hypothetical protein BG004_000768 [Podila humilis]
MAKSGKSKGHLELFSPFERRIWRVVVPLSIPADEQMLPLSGFKGPQQGRVVSGGGSGEGDGNGDGDGNGTGSGSGERNGAPKDGRKSNFDDVSKSDVRTTAPPPKLASDAQIEMHNMTMRKHLASMDMTAADAKIYMNYMENVQHEIRELRVILKSIEAKSKECVWLKNQSSGDLVDTKLIEGFTVTTTFTSSVVIKIPRWDFQQKPMTMRVCL